MGLGQSGFAGRRRVSLLLAALGAILVLLGGAPRALAAGGTISGTVTNNATTPVALSGIEVDLYDSFQNLITSKTTASNGTYSFTGLAAGNYYVGYQDSANLVYAPQFYKGATTLAGATAISLTSTGTATGINAAMVKSSNITGTVKNVSSTALSGIEVDLYDTAGNWIGSTTTGSTGTYSFTGTSGGCFCTFPAGTYVVDFNDFSNEIYAPQWYNGKSSQSSATHITVGAGATVGSINATMVKGGNITGTVTNDAATPTDLSGIEVDLYDNSGNMLTSTFTQSNGTYTFAGSYPMPLGTYKIGFVDNSSVYLPQFYNAKSSLTTATPVSITTGGQTVTGVGAKLAKGAIIQGTVTNTAATPAAVASAEVDLYDSSGNMLNSTFTASNGTYKFGGLPTGSYRVGFNPQASGLNYLGQFYKDAPNLESATPISVKPDTTTGSINAALATGGQLTGTVTAAGAAAATSTGLSGIAVTLYDTQGVQQGFTSTGSTGTYKFVGLRTGNYEVGFSDPSGTRVPMFYNGKFSLATATPVAVTAGSVKSGINQALPVGGAITGKVVSKANASTTLSNIEVQVYDAGGQYLTGTTTDSTGQYTVKGLPAGAYEVQFVDFSGKYQPIWWAGQTSIVSANPVDVAVGATTSPVNGAMAPAPAPPATGAISGTVTNSAATPAPVANVEVDVFNSSGNFVTATQTAADGTYKVASLPVGSYKVGFFPQGNYLPQYYNGASTLSSATAVSVTASTTTTGINAKLVSGGKITGTVTDNATTPAPLENVEVDAFDSSGNDIASASTAADGTYTLIGLPTGSYKVGFFPGDDTHLTQYWNNQPSLASATAVSVTAGSTTTGISAKLATGGQISGTVTNNASTPAPLANIEVDLYDSTGTVINSTVTAADGTYSFPGLPTASYKIGFSPSGSYLPQYWNNQSSLASATAISVTAGSSTTGISAKLVLGGQITGLVADASGYPLGGVGVSIYNGSGTVVQATTTAPDGTYSAPGLVAGSYKVGFTPMPLGGGVGNFAPQYYKNAATLASATAVSVSLGATASGINATLAPAGQIAGTVTDVAGHPLSDVEVDAYQGGTVVASTFTDSGGVYSIGGLNPGSYDVGFATNGGPNYTGQYYNNSSTLAGATAVAVTAGKVTTGISAALSGRAQITGTVTNNASTPADLSGVVVTVYNTSGIPLANATTGSTGVYHVTMLYAGTYHVGFAKTGYVTQYYNNQTSLATATAVTVTSGATTSGIGAKMVPTGSISGTVTDNASTPVDLAGVTVTAYNSSGTVVGTATTASTGAYTISNLVPGTDRVGFVKAGYVTQFYNNQATLAAANGVAVTSGTTTSGIGAKMVPTGSISGTVTNNAATPVALAGATVTAYNGSGTAVESTTTATNGTYTLKNLTPGTGAYRVGFSDTGHTTQYYNDQSTLAAANTISVTSGTTTSGISAKLA